MVDFTLLGLNSDVGLTTDPAFPTAVGGTVTGHHFELGLTMAASSFDNVFYFNTTNPELTSDVTDNDMEFYTNSANWPTIVFSDGTITDGSQDVSKYLVSHTTKHIGPAFLAFEITGGYNNSDIFSNEDDLKSQYVTLDASLKTAIVAKLDLGGVTGSRKSNTTAEAVASNVSREVLLSLLNGDSTAVQRVNTLLAAKADQADDVALTFATNDKIIFLVTYTVGDITTPGTNNVNDQKFKVTITLT